FWINGIIKQNEREGDYALSARSLRNNANRMRLAMLTMELANSTNPDVLKPEIDERQEAITDSLQRLEKLKAHFKDDKAASDLVTELNTVTQEYADTSKNEQIPAILRGDVAHVREISISIQGERFEKMRKLAFQIAERANSISKDRADRLMFLFQSTVAGVVAIAVVMCWLLTNVIAEPIRQLKQASERLALGDVDVELPVNDSNDEVGSLTRSFRRMVTSWKSMAGVAKRVSDGDLTVSLKHRSDKDVFADAFNSLIESVGVITAQFREAVSVVGAASEEILVSVKESAAGATQTATAATQTTAIVEEVRQTSHVASQKAKQVSEGAQKTAQITAVGRKATEDIIEGMNRIREQVDLIAEAMVRLSEKSQSISSIIATVDDLAKQSNLLAVNASIEAARAGEFGKGFGVVAQEVKSMAEQSKQSTAQVRSIIAEIQQATNAAAMATELGGKAVDAAMQQSGQAGESIAVLANSVVESAQAAAQIAVSNQQQLAGVDQVATAMASIRDACGEHLVAIRHVESAANRLSDIGGRLKHLVDRYELWEGRAAESGALGDR
ncbi:MAG TPA: methyl-accepting chemotaxis protein, partial [Candidatus Obscuribacterales bacterium]